VPGVIYADNVPYLDKSTGMWVYNKPPTIGPSSDPAIPRVLAKINYKPLTAARIGAPIPIIYGRVRTGGLLYRPKGWGSDLMAVVVWGEGEIDAIEKVYSDDVDITILTGVAAYTGTQAQTADPYVASLYGQADTLTGIAYSVLQLRSVDSLNLTAVIRGKKVYDPRVDDTLYSTNVALCLADFIENHSDYSVDWAFAEIAADYCDEIITTGIKRWEIGMVLADRKSPEEWIAVLAEFANCYVFIDNHIAKIVPDEARAVDHVLTAADIKADSFDLRKSGQRDTPTQVFCDYLLPDASNKWNEESVYTPDVSGDDPLRITRLKMGGFFRAIHAQRKATQFLNYANVTDLFCSFDMFDAGAKVTKGDVISVTHPIGLTAKEFRVLDVKAQPHGRWHIEAREYSDLVYSTEVVADPDVPDTDLPDPTAIPDGPTPTVTEKNAVMDTGVTGTYLEVSFTGVTWAFVRQYRVKVYTGSTVLLNILIPHLGEVAHTVSTPQLAEGVEYIVEVFVINIFGTQGEVPGTVNYTSVGKLVLPTNPTNCTGYEAGQLVSLTWTRSIDKDLSGYKVKRLTKALYDADIIAEDDPWVNASCVTIVERVDTTVFLTPDQPTGEYYFMVKAVDSGNRESEGFSAAYINVTADAAGGTGIERVFPDPAVLMQFAGDWFSVGDVALYDPGTTDFTVEGWVRPDVHGQNGAQLIYKSASWGTGNDGWELGIDNAGYCYAKINDGTNECLLTDTTAQPAGTNLHLAMVVKRSTNQLYLYINGSAAAASPKSSATVTGSLSNAYELKLAAVTGTSIYHKYIFRDIRYWNVARTTAEIQDNRWRVYTSPPSSLKGLWLFNEGGGHLANDTSGNNNDATLDEWPYRDGEWTYFNLRRMHVYEIHGDAVYAVTSPTVIWTGTGGLTSGQIWTYNAGDNSGDRWFDLMQTGTQTVNASIEMSTFDAQQDIQGKWTSAPEITLFNGATEVRTLRLAPEATPGVFTDYTAESVNAIARFMRYRVEETSLLAAAGLLIRLPAQVSFQGRIVEDTQEISVTANPTAVVWAEPFSAIPQISLTLVGTTARILSSDALSKTGVNLYAWDAAGVAATATVRVTARGP